MANTVTDRTPLPQDSEQACRSIVSLRLVSGYERGNSKAEFVGLVLEVLALRFGDFFSFIQHTLSFHL